MGNFLYLVRCNEYFKIGIAGNVESRLASLQTGTPYQLSLHSCYEFDNAGVVEQCLHQKFIDKHALGEWFKLNDRDIEQLGQICKLLDGKERITFPLSEEAIEKAEAGAEVIDEILSETTDKLDKHDFEQMIQEGWRIEIFGKNGNRRYWMWRRGSWANRKSIYGGLVADIPEQFRPSGTGR